MKYKDQRHICSKEFQCAYTFTYVFFIVTLFSSYYTVQLSVTDTKITMS